MKVFLSWSGERSRLVAEALRDWLPGVLQSVQPWLSSKDIGSGTRWSSALADVLSETDVGIVCLTAENLSANWLLFEAGALSKASRQALLCLYALDVDAADIAGPLAQFQAAAADKSGTFRLLAALNERAGEGRLRDELLRQVFELWWPRLEAVLKEIRPAQPSTGQVAPPPANSIEDKLDRIIGLLERQGVPSTTLAAGGTTGPATRRARPRAFIGSSTEGLPVAHAIQELLDPVAECTVWNQGVFSPGATYIESLQDARLVHDFAVIVATPDDEATKRGKTAPVPRDNLLFELGLFSGALGRARTFLVVPAEGAPELPSDLSGVTVAKYRARSDGNLLAALGPAVSQIRRAMGIASEAG